MPSKKPNKHRIEFRKGHQGQPRRGDLTREYGEAREEIDTVGSQRVSGKGDLTRRRTVRGTLGEGNADPIQNIDLETSDGTILGTVLRVHGLESIARTDDGRTLRCAVRRVLKSVSTQQRHIVVTGDRVEIEPHGQEQRW
ncbi:MAG: ribosome small subunit-dependent GTPase A, partial [Pirellulaceae bacterium]